MSPSPCARLETRSCTSARGRGLRYCWRLLSSMCGQRRRCFADHRTQQFITRVYVQRLERAGLVTWLHTCALAAPTALPTWVGKAVRVGMAGWVSDQVLHKEARQGPQHSHVHPYMLCGSLLCFRHVLGSWVTCGSRLCAPSCQHCLARATMA
jgi:hypothetical protein